MVKRFAKHFVIVLGALFAYSVQAAITKNAQELFLRANKEYKKAQYKKARDLYDAIEHKGRAVHYNLGNCCYELKEYPQAIAWWRRAQEGAPLSEQQDIEYNINRARQAEGFSEINHPKWYRLLRASVVPFPLILIQLLFLLAWYWLFWALVIRRDKKGIKSMILIAGLVCLIVWLGAVLFVQYQSSSYPQAVVHRTTAVYAGPHNRYHVVGELASTDELKIVEQRTGWCKIMHEQTYGWVPVYNLTII